MITIPIIRHADDASFFDQQVTLEDVTYTLEFRWNVRLGAWFMTVLDSAGETPVLVGVRCVVNYGIPSWLVDRTPPGLFGFVDTGAAPGEGEDPGYDDLGSRVQLVYIPEAEIG